MHPPIHTRTHTHTHTHTQCSYLFAAHATGGRATVWETSRWDFHQWDADCRTAAWAATSAGPALSGREVLFTVERGPLDDDSDDVVVSENDGGGRRGDRFGSSNSRSRSSSSSSSGKSSSLGSARSSQAAAAAAERNQGAYTAVQAYSFSIAEPLCDHEHYALDVGGDGLLDIREVAVATTTAAAAAAAAATRRRQKARPLRVGGVGGRVGGDGGDGDDDDDDDDEAAGRRTKRRHRSSSRRVVEILDIAVTPDAKRLVVSHTTPGAARVAAVSVYQLSLEPVRVRFCVCACVRARVCGRVGEWVRVCLGG